MRRARVVVALCVLVVMAAAACSDADGDAADECCPISDEPECDYFLRGGAKSSADNGGSCRASGNNSSLSPATKTVDDKGCPVWIDTGPAVYCGDEPDSGGDARSPVDVFVPEDAPAE